MDLESSLSVPVLYLVNVVQSTKYIWLAQSFEWQLIRW